MNTTLRTSRPLRGFFLVLVAFALLDAGCRTAVDPDEEILVPESVQKARELFEANRLTDSILACTDIARKDPLTPGLAQLQADIKTRLAEMRQRGTAKQMEPSASIALEDIDRQGILPDTYRLRQHVVGETKPIHTLPPEMQQALAKPVTIHLENVGLNEIIAQIGTSQNINIVADGELSEATMTVHVDDTPLSEVLEYIGRNLGVTFAIGQKIIWVTAGNETAGGVPLLTRIFRLRKGLTKDELDGAPDGIGIIEAITRFVPEVEGADILFNSKSHAILVKNTRENMRLIEDIIEALDVRPPQVLIEARFISTGVKDMRELGVDWLLTSPYLIMSRKNGQVNHVSQIDGTITQAGFANDSSGLNLSYQGILTDPAFQAVLHAFEQDGDTRTLSVPRVTTINNKEAKLRIGEDFRFFEEYDVEEIRTGTNDNGNETYESRLVPTGSPTLEELGIELVATPSVGADLASINLKLAPEISEFVRWEYWERAVDSSDNDDDDDDNDSTRTADDTALGMIKLPIFRRSTIETEVTVRSGETVVMGGLISSSRVKTISGVPVLSKIPLIGRLFQHDTWENTSQNLIIFVTATLISDIGEELFPLTPPEPLTSGGKVELGVDTTEPPAVPAPLPPPDFALEANAAAPQADANAAQPAPQADANAAAVQQAVEAVAAAVADAPAPARANADAVDQALEALVAPAPAAQPAAAQPAAAQPAAAQPAAAQPAANP